MARLIIDAGEGSGREFPVAGAVVIGRLKTNPVPIEDAKASREHTAVRCVGADYFVADLDSKNGTYLNGRLIHGQERLHNGDQIQIGRTVLRFVEDPEDAARRSELAAQAAAPPPKVVASPVAVAPSPPPSEAREPVPAPRPTPRAEPFRPREPGAAERAFSFVRLVLIFALSVFAARFLATLAIQKMMGH